MARQFRTRLATPFLLLGLAFALLAARSEASARGALTPALVRGQALVCFYRDLDWHAERDHYAISTRDQWVGSLARNTFLVHVFPPGRQIVYVQSDVKVSRSFELGSGKIHYIKVGSRTSALYLGPKLMPVDEKMALRQISALGYAGSGPADSARHVCLRDSSADRQ